MSHIDFFIGYTLKVSVNQGILAFARSAMSERAKRATIDK
jgi:hypothetical protein